MGTITGPGSLAEDAQTHQGHGQRSYAWAIVQRPAGEGGSFKVMPAKGCGNLPDFFGPQAKEAFDTGTATLVDYFRTREAGERFLKRLGVDVARGVWEWRERLRALA